MGEWYQVNCPKHGLVGNNKSECDWCDCEPQERHEQTHKRAVALDKQVGGEHYKSKGIQPVEYIMANNIGFCEGSAIKYLTRWKDKGGIEDLKKAKHFIEILIDAQKLPN